MARYFRNKATGELLTESQFVALTKAKPAGETGGGAIANAGTYNFEDPKVIQSLPISALTKSIISGVGSAKDLTPTDKSKVVEEMYKVGYNPKEYINRKLGALVDEYKKVPEGWKGLLQGRLPLRSSISPEVASFESARTILTREIARLNDVGVLSNQDVAAYNSAMPALGDRNLEVVEAKARGVGVALGGGLVNGAQSGQGMQTSAPGITGAPGSPERIAALQADTEKYKTDASRSMTSRFLGALPRAAAEVMLKNPAKFVASTALAPVDIARGAYGLATGQDIGTIDTEIPLIGRTFQSEGAQKIREVQQKSDSGQKLEMGDYAKALSPFLEVPLAAVETVGLARGVQKAGATTRRLFQDRQTARSIKTALDVVSPAADKRGRIDAFIQAGKPGGVARGRFGRVVRTPSKEDVEIAKAVSPIIRGKDPVKNATAIKEAISEFSSESIRPYLRANPRAYNPQTLAAHLAKVDPPDWIKADATAERTYKMVVARMVEAAQKRPGTMEGLWDSRIDFDALVKQQFGEAVFDINKKAFINRAISDVRHAVHDFIAASTGDSQFQQSMKYLTRLFRAVENIAEKNQKLVEAPSKARKVLGTVGRGIGYTALGVGTGVGINALGIGSRD